MMFVLRYTDWLWCKLKLLQQLLKMQRRQNLARRKVEIPEVEVKEEEEEVEKEEAVHHHTPGEMLY